jgi:hypothetical protein
MSISHAALLTGCSSGTDRATALRLHAAGLPVHATARPDVRRFRPGSVPRSLRLPPAPPSTAPCNATPSTHARTPATGIHR